MLSELTLRLVLLLQKVIHQQIIIMLHLDPTLTVCASSANKFWSCAWSNLRAMFRRGVPYISGARVHISSGRCGLYLYVYKPSDEYAFAARAQLRMQGRLFHAVQPLCSPFPAMLCLPIFSVCQT